MKSSWACLRFSTDTDLIFRLPTPPSLTPSSSTTTLLVFGLPLNGLKGLQRDFESYGEVIKYEPDSNGGQWYVLTFKDPVHASYALRKNGMEIPYEGGMYMLGFSTREPGLMGNSVNGNGNEQAVMNGNEGGPNGGGGGSRGWGGNGGGVGTPLQPQSGSYLKSPSKSKVVQNGASQWQDEPSTTGTFASWLVSVLPLSTFFPS